MKLLIMSDIHRRFDMFRAEDMPDSREIDVVVVAGDITNYGKVKRTATIYSLYDWECASLWMRYLDKKYPGRLLWVPGNHDINVESCDLPGFMLGLNRLATRAGFAFIGSSLSTAFDAPRLAEVWAHTTADMATDMKHWDQQARVYTQSADFKDYPLIVVSHCPPLGYCDLAHGNRHIGSPGLTQFVRTFQPRLVICGHVHEAVGEAMLGETRIINTAEKWQVVEL